MRALAFIFVLAIPFLGLGQDFPAKPDRLVNDYTSTLSKSDQRSLEEKLVSYDNESSVQIAIVIIKSLDGYEISDYAFRLGEEWGIGQAETDNGALILVSMNDRKMWIATGYGLESTVTDEIAKRIVEIEMKPRFRKGDFAGGLSAASDAIIKASKGEYQGKGNGGGRKSKGIAWPFVLFFGVFFLLVILGLMAKVSDARDYARINNIGFWAAWALLNASTRSHGGSWGHFSGGSGSFGGGGFGGGSSFGGGGGFGGFGGGSFGGGGAGGSW